MAQTETGLNLTDAEKKYLDHQGCDWRQNLLDGKPIPVIVLGETEPPVLRELKKKVNIHVVALLTPDDQKM